MSRVAVKICGITEERDAVEAALLGADAIGFHFSTGSPRRIEPEAARRICERLPAFLARVGVFAGEPLIRVLEVARTVGLTAVQLQGPEDAVFCSALAPHAWIKTVEFGPGTTSESFEGYACATYLLDASGWPRGSGPDWGRARRLSVHGRMVLSGGLRAENVAEAIEAARPYGVDAGPTLEIAPGKMDLDRIEAFVEAVRRAERSLGD